jgi:ribosomal protein S18 acetylase RimI-like enzyme
VEEISARVRLERTEPEGIIFVLDDELPIAYCWTSRAKNEFGSIGYISMTGARPEYRGKGIGTAAVKAGMGYLESRGVDRIELEVSAENIAALDLYVNLGFARTKETFWYEKRLS